MKVSDILAVKGSDVVTINDEASAFEALSTFAQNRVGSLLVLDAQGGIVGILAPRDVLMAVLNECERIKQILVKDLMTRDVIIGSPDDDLETVQAIMTEKRIRHLPIIAEKKLAGIISIGDVVKAQLTEKRAEIRYLHDYIIGRYPA